jgi:hypothetical protein
MSLVTLDALAALGADVAYVVFGERA